MIKCCANCISVVKCGKPHADNAHLVNPQMNYVYTYNEYVAFICNFGYQTQTTEGTIRCNGNGTWDNLPKCNGT